MPVSRLLTWALFTGLRIELVLANVSQYEALMRSPDIIDDIGEVVDGVRAKLGAVYSNFDIVLDHFSRCFPALHLHTCAACRLLRVSVLIVCWLALANRWYA